MIVDEVWKQVPGMNYEASIDGCIRRVGSRKCLKQTIRRKYFSVHISLVDIDKTTYVHKLVAAAFIGPRPDGHEINHKDGNKYNNEPTNLEYVTPDENRKHAMRIGLVKAPIVRVRAKPEKPFRNAKLSLDQVSVIRARFDAGNIGTGQIAQEYGVSRWTIQRIVTRRAWEVI